MLDKIEDAGIKINRAQELLDGLAEENQRWERQKLALETDLGTVESDMLLSSAVVSYLGPYT